LFFFLFCFIRKHFRVERYNRNPVFRVFSAGGRRRSRFSWTFVLVPVSVRSPSARSFLAASRVPANSGKRIFREKPDRKSIYRTFTAQ